jgi:prefoldin subunit 5
MAEQLTTVEVLKRERERFERRHEKAQKEADDAKAEMDKIDRALEVISDSNEPGGE